MAVSDDPDRDDAIALVRQLLSHILEAPFETDSLSGSMQSLTKALHGDVGVLLVRNPHSQDISYAVTNRHAPGADTVALSDSAQSWAETLWPKTPGVSRPLLNANLGGLADPMSEAMVAPIGSHGVLAILRQMPQPRFDDTECDLLNQVAGQLEPAVSLLGLMAEQERCLSLARGILDMMTVPVLVTRADSHLLWANTKAQAVLERRDGLYLVDGRVEAHGLRSNVRLQALISHVAESGRTGSTAAQALAITRGPGHRPLGVVLRPLRPYLPTEGSSPVSGTTGLVVIDLSGVDHHDAPQEGLLQALFALTPAEAALLQALATGRKIEEHAQARGVSVTTVRTQLAHLFRKTGTNRQPELVRLALKAIGVFAVTDE